MADGGPEGTRNDADASATRDYPRRLVRDVMTPGVVCAHPDAVFKEIVDALSRNRVSTVPVLDEQRHVVGVVSASDLLTRMAGSPGVVPRGHRMSARREIHRKAHAGTARELMTSPAITTGPDVTIVDAAIELARSRVRCLPVVDDDNVLVGIVSRDDLVTIFLRSDEDIRNEVERDVIARRMRVDPSSVRVSVNEGVVTLAGELERRLATQELVQHVARVPGVVDVVDKLSYRVDDVLSAMSPVWPRY